MHRSPLGQSHQLGRGGRTTGRRWKRWWMASSRTATGFPPSANTFRGAKSTSVTQTCSPRRRRHGLACVRACVCVFWGRGVAGERLLSPPPLLAVAASYVVGWDLAVCRVVSAGVIWRKTGGKCLICPCTLLSLIRRLHMVRLTESSCFSPGPTRTTRTCPAPPTLSICAGAPLPPDVSCPLCVSCSCDCVVVSLRWRVVAFSSSVLCCCFN